MAKRKTATPSKDKKSKKQFLPPINCKGCDTSFIPRDRRTKFHSESCREEYYSRTYFHKETKRKKCPNCGSMFPTSAPKKQKFCNDVCREEYRKKQREGLIESIDEKRIKFFSDRFKTFQNADFRCSYCGQTVADGIKLDVEPTNNGEYRTVCDMCMLGRSNVNK